MLKMNCIFDSPSILPQIIKLVEKKAHKLNSKGKSAKVDDVYRELRDDGFEIDAESIAFAYQNIPSIINKKNFSTSADLKRFGGEGIKKAIEIANKGDIKKQRLGKYSINTTIANGVANTFSAIQNTNDVDKSKLFEFQEVMRKVVNAKLSKLGNKVPPKTFTETLNKLFEIEDTQAALSQSMKGKITGKANTVEEIWQAMQADIQKIATGIKDKADKQRFLEMTEDVRKSNYELLLGTREADGVVKDILKQIGYVKTVNRKGVDVEVVDWNKAAENQNDWQQEFSEVLLENGFSEEQMIRIIERLDRNYNAALSRYAEGQLNMAQKNNNLKQQINRSALNRLIKLKNAGIFNPANRAILNDVMGADIPKYVAAQVEEIVSDYGENIKETGGISNVENEEVSRAIKALIGDLNKGTGEQIVNAIGDYQGLKAGSIIATSLNAFQNITSGINSSVLSTITALIKSRNPKLIGSFIKSFTNTLLDVSAGGVTIRDAHTINANELVQGRGGLSDRWVWDNVKSWNWSALKAALNTLPHVTGTAFDAANGSVIYNARMINSVRPALMAKGLSSKEANKAIDDILFGKHSSGISNREFWVKEAKKRLENQAGVKDREIKASRVADEIIWSKLVTDYGFSVDAIKAMQSAAIEQKSRDLGHQSDVYISPSFIIESVRSGIAKKMDEAKKEGNATGYVFLNSVNVAFNALNMFVGGKANWAILTLQNSPIGILLGGLNIAGAEIFAQGQTPLYRQQLDVDNPEKLREQLAKRAAIRGRFEKGIYGTIIQGLLYAAIMAVMNGGGDDDEEDERADSIKKVFDKYMEDPKTKRFLDKFLPMTLAAEIQFAYDKNTGQIDRDRLSNLFFLPQYAYGTDVVTYFKSQIVSRTGYDKLQDSYNYNDKFIKDSDTKAVANTEATWRFIGETVGVPYVGWYKVTSDELKLYRNGFEPEEGAMEAQKDKYKNELKNLDGAMDAFFYGMGMQSTYDFFKNKEK